MSPSEPVARPTTPIITPPITRVLAAVIARDGRFLIGRRPADKRHGGLWEFPGGKVELGETDHQAMARELREELALTLISIGAERYVARDGASPFEIVFLDAVVEGVPRALEHAELSWVAAQHLPDYPLAPCDAECAQILLNRG